MIIAGDVNQSRMSRSIHIRMKAKTNMAIPQNLKPLKR